MNVLELEEILSSSGIKTTAREVSKIMGIDETSYSRKKRQQTEIKTADVVNIFRYFDVKNEMSNNDNMVKLKYFPDAYATCGEGGFITSDNYELLEVPTSLIEGFNHSDVYSVINARSNSMSPIIMPSDLLIVKHSNIIEDEKIHIFTMDDKIFCKFLSLNLDEILIKSANNEYKNMSVKCDDITVNGVVKGLIRKF